jgi:glycine/D-amino acid oxidase-like deaminating enzyme
MPVWQPPARPSVPDSPLDQNEEADLAIVGGGILGLSTALGAARMGASVRLLEAGRIGRCASGLNGGQVIPGLKYDPDWLVERFGRARGTVEFAASTADAVFDLIRAERLDVPHVRNGWIQAAHTATAMRAAEERDRQWARNGAETMLLDAGAIAALTGARGYLGGWLDRRAGVINPLAYTLELARIAGEAGARLAQDQRVTALARSDGRWQVTTADGARVSAKNVVVATNAYSDALVPGLARSLVTLHSFQIATAPLDSELSEQILPQGQAVSDSRRIVIYYRRSLDGRFVLGGRGRMSIPRSPRDWRHLQRAMRRLYPQLGDVAVEMRWFGRVAMTPDHLPHIHEPEKGLLAAVGCQGRGLGLMTAMGARLAHYALAGDERVLPFPITPLRPIPLHEFRQIGVAATIAWYRMLDALER